MSAAISSSDTSTPITRTSRSAPRLRLDMLDGIRGLAALYVALFHAIRDTGTVDMAYTQTTGMLRLVVQMLNYGSYAVPVFIVLSGFCLMLPLVQQGVQEIPGGVWAYIRRRAWRILPAYYVTLVLCLLLIAIRPVLQTPQNTDWDLKIPVTLGPLLSHVLLVHNLSENWIYKIDGPMWSIATEWQIYFLFPWLLLPILRRSNIIITIIAGLLVGIVPHFLLSKEQSIDFAHLWFVGLFAMGMAAAMMVFSEKPLAVRCRALVMQRWPNRVWTLLVVIGLAVMPVWMEWHQYISEPLVGIAVMGWLIEYATCSRTSATRSWSQRLLESRALVGLGAFSYSIYLIHNPIQAWINLETLHLPLSANTRLLLMVGVVTPLAVLCSYGFYLLFERRFMRLKQRRAPTLDTPLRTTRMPSE